MTQISATYHRKSSPADETQTPNGWTVRRDGRIFSRRSTLGEVAALISRCDAAAPSKWTVEGITVRAGWDAGQILERLSLYGRVAAADAASVEG